MVVVLNPLFSSCCKIGKREAGKFEHARGLNALASVLWVPCYILVLRVKIYNLFYRLWSIQKEQVQLTP